MKLLKEEGGMGTPWPFPVLPEPNYVHSYTRYDCWPSCLHYLLHYHVCSGLVCANDPSVLYILHAEGWQF